MDHPFNVQLYNVINTDRHLFVFMDYLESGSLLDSLSPSGRLSEVQSRRYFYQILAALTIWTMSAKSPTTTSTQRTFFLIATTISA
jgi:serine/threonine protein kinase